MNKEWNINDIILNLSEVQDMIDFLNINDKDVIIEYLENAILKLEASLLNFEDDSKMKDSSMNIVNDLKYSLKLFKKEK